MIMILMKLQETDISLRKEIAVLGKIKVVILSRELEDMVEGLNLPHSRLKGLYICNK
jgi:hypothetical protein